MWILEIFLTKCESVQETILKNNKEELKEKFKMPHLLTRNLKNCVLYILRKTSSAIQITTITNNNNNYYL